MSLIEKAKAHFATFAARRIEVPEWGDPGQPLVLFAEPLTLAEMRRLRRENGSDEFGYLVALVILKAKTADGQPAFTLEHKHDLQHRVHPNVIARIAGEIAAASTVEEQAKN